MVQLTRRNTRRYGGYIVHFGVVLIFIGISGQAFNQSKEQTHEFKQSFSIGPYRVECLDYSQDSNANYDTEFALLNVYRGDQDRNEAGAGAARSTPRASSLQRLWPTTPRWCGTFT